MVCFAQYGSIRYFLIKNYEDRLDTLWHVWQARVCLLTHATNLKANAHDSQRRVRIVIISNQHATVVFTSKIQSFAHQEKWETGGTVRAAKIPVQGTSDLDCTFS